MRGKVKWFNTDKGFGFIEPEYDEEQREFFLHHSQVPKGVKLKGGEVVEFVPVETEKGHQAQAVEVVE